MAGKEMTTKRPSLHGNTVKCREGARSTNDQNKGPPKDNSYEANPYDSYEDDSRDRKSENLPESKFLRAKMFQDEKKSK